MNYQKTLNAALKNPWVAFPMAVMARFGRDNGGLFAAGLAFFMLLSFAPLILTSVACMAFFIHDPASAALNVQHLVEGLFPSGGAQREIHHFLTDKLNVNGQVDSLVRGRTIAGLIGFATLIWTSMQIFVNASTAMNAAFEVTEKRNWLLLRGIAFGLLLSSGILISLTLFLSTAPSAIAHFKGDILPSGIPVWILTIVFEILAVLLNAVMYFMIYRFLPSAEVGWKAAAIGGFSASFFWEVAKKGLATWLLKENHSLYGNLGDLILFVLWIYYSMTILLIGAEIAAEFQITGSFKEHAKSTRKPSRTGHIRDGSNASTRKPGKSVGAAR